LLGMRRSCSAKADGNRRALQAPFPGAVK
jgi:hypothetical protein